MQPPHRPFGRQPDRPRDHLEAGGDGRRRGRVEAGADLGAGALERRRALPRRPHRPRPDRLPRRLSWRPAAPRPSGGGRPTRGGRSAPGRCSRAAAGADLADLEFCQFHPTALALPGTPFDGLLITEAVRGEGATLLDASGARFTDELAPRDAVTAAILDHIEADGDDGVQLDLRGSTPPASPTSSPRSPRRASTRRRADPGRPRRPLHDGRDRGRPRGPLLAARPLAVGECSCTGLHGANRLASNSLSECFVFGSRAAAAALARAAAERPDPAEWRFEPPTEETRDAVWRLAGPVRDAERWEQLPTIPTRWRGDRHLRAGPPRVPRRPPAHRLPGHRPGSTASTSCSTRTARPAARVVLSAVPAAGVASPRAPGRRRGGTFTDAVLLDGERIHTARADHPGDQSVGVIAAVEAVLARAGAEPAEVEVLRPRDDRRHQRPAGGTGRPHRADRDPRLRRPARDRPPGPAPPLPALRAQAGTPGRAGAALRGGGAGRPRGGDRAARRGRAGAAAAELRDSDAESVADLPALLLPRPGHEAGSPSTCGASCPESTSPPRTRSCLASASTSAARPRRSTPISRPLLGRYLKRLERGGGGTAGLPPPLVMQSSGGVAPAAEAARAGAWSVLSGPAGGAVGAGLLAEAQRRRQRDRLRHGRHLLDVCVVGDGAVRRRPAPPRRAPDADADGEPPHCRRGRRLHRLRDPGAPCGSGRTRRGRARPRLLRPRRHRADRHRADVVLGTSPVSRVARGQLDAGAAVRRSASSAPNSASATEIAEGWSRCHPGDDPRPTHGHGRARPRPAPLALLPFGGAGPMHAAEIAAELGIERILCPRAGGVLSALGLCASDRRRDTARTVMLEGGGAQRRAHRRRGGRADGEGWPARTCRTPSPRWSTRCATRARPSSCRSRGRPSPTRPIWSSASSVPTRTSTATATPTARWSSSTSAWRWSRPGHVPRPAAGGGAPPQESERRVRFGGEWVATPVLRGEPRLRHGGRGAGRLRAAGRDLRRPARLVGPVDDAGDDPGGRRS